MKKILLLLIFCLSLLVSCGEEDYTEEEARNDFSHFYDENFDTVMLFDGEYLIFNNFELNFYQMFDGSNRAIIVKNREVFVVSFSVREINIFNKYIESIDIWKMDLYGNNRKIVFQIKDKGEIKLKSLQTTKNRSSFYIEYKIDRMYFIDSFNVENFEYVNVEKSKNVPNVYKYAEFNEKDNSIYSGERINKSNNVIKEYKIENSSTGRIQYVDEDVLKENDVYKKTSIKYDYRSSQIIIKNNHIYLFYEINAGDWSTYEYVIFEYYFETNSLDFKMLVFLYDCINIEMVYIGR